MSKERWGPQRTGEMMRSVRKDLIDKKSESPPLNEYTHSYLMTFIVCPLVSANLRTRPEESRPLNFAQPVGTLTHRHPSPVLDPVAS